MLDMGISLSLCGTLPFGGQFEDYTERNLGDKAEILHSMEADVAQSE